MLLFLVGVAAGIVATLTTLALIVHSHDTGAG